MFMAGLYHALPVRQAFHAKNWTAGIAANPLLHPAMNEPRVNIPEWTVTELSAALKKTVEDAYGFVRVRGEITGYRGPHSSGHAYFALKDEGAKIDAVIWRTAFGRIRFKPQEGLEVIATGRLTTYPGRSSYQIVIENLEPAGVGALMALLEERKKKLAAEGLFDEARKQLIPFLPGVIGVITSPTGAVIRDILHRLADRFPRRVLVWPVRVQGDGSAEEVANAIHGFNALPEAGRIPRPDVLIVARGGGSLEDLWSFNEEIVVRAAAQSMIPLISAVGHETDITLIDFASDKRCPTPTAAAECAVPVRSELLAQVDSLARRRVSSWARGMEARRTEFRAASRAFPEADELLALPRQKLDQLADRLPRALHANAQIHHKQYLRCASRLSPPLLRGRVQRSRERLTNAGGRLTAAMRANILGHRQRVVRDRERIAALFERGERAVVNLIERRFAALDRADRLLGALSYQGVLARGFALVRDDAGHPLRSALSIAQDQRLDIEFTDGRVKALATDAQGAPPKPRQPIRPRPRRRFVDPGQGSLF
jgi:exodeoxyribonuclease VII large subunit